MGNYKIRVANEAESKEVQEFLKSNGYERKIGNFKLIDGWVCINEKMMILCVSVSQAGDELNEYKELTLPQLKDLVVLKRNDPKDGTHVDYDNKPWYVTSDGLFYCFEYEREWVKENERVFKRYQAKPIEPTMSILDTGRLEMKEFLVKSVSDGNYHLVTGCHSSVADGVEAIEVPVGADFLMLASDGYKTFWSGDTQINVDTIDTTGNTVDFKGWCLHWNAVVLWKRETLNDKVVSAEVARVEDKHSHYKKDISHLDVLDIYRIDELFNPHPCGSHIAKKALCSGRRGHKDLLTDIQDIIDTAERWKQMLIEDENRSED